MAARTSIGAARAEPEPARHARAGVYGATTLAEIDRALVERARARGATVECYQSNIEGELVDRIQAARGRAQAIVINPAAYTHTSMAIADALARGGAARRRGPPVQRARSASRFGSSRSWRPVCVGTIGGFGARGYYLALDAVLDLLEEKPNHESQRQEARAVVAVQRRQPAGSIDARVDALAEVLRRHELTEIEVEEGGVRIYVRRGGGEHAPWPRRMPVAVAARRRRRARGRSRVGRAAGCRRRRPTPPTATSPT